MTLEDQKLVEEINKLPIDYWNFCKEDTKEYTHGIHNYPAMMIYPISRNIIKLVKNIRPVHALFDPFVAPCPFEMKQHIVAELHARLIHPVTILSVSQAHYNP